MLLLHRILQDGINHFSDQTYLKYETELLNKAIASVNTRFRGHKDFKSLKKLKKTLHNFFEMNLSDSLMDFKSLLPDSNLLDDLYFPARSNLEYILVRLQGAGKLCARIFETCKISANLLLQKIHIGQYWNVCLIIFSFVSRIFIVIKNTIKFVSDLYAKLLLFSTKLQNTNTAWLPKGYKFPKDLITWLDIKDLESEMNVIEIEDETPDLIKYFSLIEDEDDDEVQFCGEYIMLDDEKEANTSRKSNQEQIECIDLRGFDLDEDIGEVIEIDETFDDSVMIVDEEIKPQAAKKKLNKKKVGKKKGKKNKGIL